LIFSTSDWPYTPYTGDWAKGFATYSGQCNPPPGWVYVDRLLQKIAPNGGFGNPPPKKKQPGSEVMRQHCEKNIHDENNDILKIKFNLFHKK